MTLCSIDGAFRVPLRRRALLGGLLGVAGTLSAPHVARAAQRRVRFGHNNTDASNFGQGAQVFADAVGADPVLAGVLKVEIYGNAQLGDDVSMLNACMKGTLDGGFIGTSIVSNVVPALGILNAPYLFRNATHARTVLDGPTGAEYLAVSAGKGLPVLAWGENGLRHISSNVKVRTIEDIRGLKLRVPQSPVMLNGMRALGADAAPLSFGLLRGALQSGEFQAQENAVSVVETAKLYEVQKYLCLTGHIYDAIGFIASADLMEDLTEAQRVALTGCAVKGAAVTRAAADAAARDGVGRLKALGMEIVSDVDVDGMRTAARPFLESLAPTFGADRVKSLLAAGA